MKTLVVESTPTVLRWTIESEIPADLHKSHRLIGSNHLASDEWIWTSGNQRLTTFEDERTTAGELWRELLMPDNQRGLSDATKLLVHSARAVVDPNPLVDRLVYLIPENIPEISQNALIRELGSQFGVGQSEVYLLWRSVALALATIDQIETANHLIMADFGHERAEITRLELCSEKGSKCPVRDFTIPRGSGCEHGESVSNWVNRNYDKGNGDWDPWQGQAGANIAELLEADLNFDPPQVWRQKGLSYRPIPVAHNEFAEPVEFEPSLTAVREFMGKETIDQDASIIWHGWPVYWQGSEVICRNLSNSTLLEPDGALTGGVRFARRHREKKPTYFEDLPGYEIWCRNNELGFPRRWQWESLIARRKIDGTATTSDDPIDGFQLNAGTQDFTVDVRMTGETEYRHIEAKLPSQITNPTPILIHSQIRPTGGGVKIALVPPRDKPDLFGKKARVTLKWDQAKKMPQSKPENSQNRIVNYSYPFIIGSEGSEEKRQLLEPIGEQVRGGESLDNVRPSLEKIIVPAMANNFEVPFGGRPVSAGLSRNLDHLVKEICKRGVQEFANERDPDTLDWKWTRLISCLFHYADDDVRNALYEKALSVDYPMSSNKKYNIRRSAIFNGFGRICRKPDHLEDYLKRVLEDWDRLDRLPWVIFWPFQKCLGYYGEPARMRSELVYGVLECAVEMLDRIIMRRLPRPAEFGQNNWKKWTLAAILYGLRFRELNTYFLNFESGTAKDKELAENLRKRLKHPEIIQTIIPRLALKGISIPPGQEPSLPELILRFLEARADETDIELAGGIGRTS